MPVDLSQTFDLHRRIISELNLRESVIKEQETAARRALEDALQNIAAEKHAIKQCRELLSQAEMLYQSFAGEVRVSRQHNVLQPTAPPIAAAAPQQPPDTAPTAAGGEPPPPPKEEFAPAADASIEAQVFSRVQNLRGEISAETERVGNWWATMWRRGSRNPEEELSWKEAYPPVEGAERAIWDHHNANRTED